jgi:hypothetical protein
MTDQINIDTIFDQYLQRTINAINLYQQDAAYHMQLKWLYNTLVEFDNALIAENMPIITRMRILQTVLEQSIESTTDAIYRMQTMQKLSNTI